VNDRLAELDDRLRRIDGAVASDVRDEARRAAEDVARSVTALRDEVDRRVRSLDEAQQVIRREQTDQVRRLTDSIDALTRSLKETRDQQSDHGQTLSRVTKKQEDLGDRIDEVEKEATDLEAFAKRVDEARKFAERLTGGGGGVAAAMNAFKEVLKTAGEMSGDKNKVTGNQKQIGADSNAAGAQEPEMKIPEFLLPAWAKKIRDEIVSQLTASSDGQRRLSPKSLARVVRTATDGDADARGKITGTPVAEMAAFIADQLPAGCREVVLSAQHAQTWRSYVEQAVAHLKQLTGGGAATATNAERVVHSQPVNDPGTVTVEE
jgi:hypothetical protein